MVTPEQFINGILLYYESEFCQKATGIGKFSAYFIAPGLPQLVKAKLDQFRASPLACGVFNQDGLIDLDVVRDRATQAMTHCGSIDIMGFRLNASDVDILYDKIRRA